jgi:hypothetical protein
MIQGSALIIIKREFQEGVLTASARYVVKEPQEV